MDNELGEFLRTRRSRVAPEQVGMARAAGPRRTPGLRREELAALTGISVDYYTRIEQGRARQPSPAVLESIADALRLDDGERAHLFALVHRDVPRERGAADEGRVSASIRRLLDALPTPAWVVNHRLDVLVWNRGAAALITDWAELPVRERNLLRFVFLDPRARGLWADWPGTAAEYVGKLRSAAARRPDDPTIVDLVAELSRASEEFVHWWNRHDVAMSGRGRVEYRHPEVGRLCVDYESLRLAGPGEQRLIVVNAEPGSRTAERLRTLADPTRGSRPGTPNEPVTPLDC
ncbi:helix-turn-helix transcriptional regulator [Streptomyces sp. NPDC096205]|uniref:helix-turn-helix transcriptional regulator n=1 Tax=Streptomyces sp. NPDC096205 TaxID=3366081 RepID=UPI003824FB84